MAAKTSVPEFSARELAMAFRSMAPALAGLKPHDNRKADGSARMIAALRGLTVPIGRERSQGGLLNIWAIVGLRRDEVRNAHCLANLWMMDFGGDASRKFLAAFLHRAIRDVDWVAELSQGYQVATEISPLGDKADRVDLVIETPRRTIGIEVKIDADLGPKQLPRYVAAIETRARWRHADPNVILLAPFDCTLPGVSAVNWSAVTDAARSLARSRSTALTFVEDCIVRFGDHVRAF